MSGSGAEVGAGLGRAAVRTAVQAAVQAAVHALRGQQDLWEYWLCRPEASGVEARALVGEPPLRWSGRRLRGRVLPDGAVHPGQCPPR